MDKLRNLDLFPKVNDDFYQRTASGGVITIGSCLIMAALFPEFEYDVFISCRPTANLFDNWATKVATRWQDKLAGKALAIISNGRLHSGISGEVWRAFRQVNALS